MTLLAFRRLADRLLRPVPHAIGLEIGSTSVRIAEVRGNRVVRYDEEPLEPGAISRGAVQNPDEVARALGELVSRNRLQRRYVVLSVSNAAASTQVLPLPKPEQADELAHQAFPAEQLVLSHVVLPPVEEAGPPDLMVVAAPREPLENLIELVQSSGLQVLSAEPHYIGFLHPYEGVIAGSGDQPVAFLELGYSATVLAVAFRGAIRFVGHIDLGIADLIQEIARNNALENFAAAEQVYRRHVSGETPTSLVDIQSDIEAFTAHLAREIQSRYNRFASPFQVRSGPATIFLSGGGALAPWAHEMLKELWPEGNVIPANPFAYYSPPPRIGAPPDAARWSAVVGHAATGAGAEHAYALDLLPPEYRKRFTPDWYRTAAVVLVIVAAGAGLTVYRNYERELQRQEETIRILEAKIQALQPYLKSRAELNRELKEAERTRARLNALQDQRIPWVPSLSWFFASLPKDDHGELTVRLARLTAQTRLRGGQFLLELNIEGQAADRNAFFAFLKNTEQGPYTLDFQSATREKTGRLRFDARYYRTQAAARAKGAEDGTPESAARGEMAR